MKFLSLQPFVPSGKDFEGSKEFFQQLGFAVN
jgi:predicted lactoylglutathione lyase